MAGAWVEASRPRTLPASVAPVLVGTAAAQRLILWRAAAALVVAVAVQVGVNFANDYFDGVRGVDSDARLGPRRAVAAGLVAPPAMRAATAAALGTAAVAGVLLAAAVGWELLLVGALSFLAALGYSGGPRPYASIPGGGEVFVFVFFGLVATVGSQYVQDERLSPVSVVAGTAVGLLAVAILEANNLRDIPTDREVGKRTLAVVLGARSSRGLYTALVVGALVGVVAVAAAARSWWPLVGLVATPLAARATARVRRSEGSAELIHGLEATAQLHLVLGVLLAAGLWLR